MIAIVRMDRLQDGGEGTYYTSPEVTYLMLSIVWELPMKKTSGHLRMSVRRRRTLISANYLEL